MSLSADEKAYLAEIAPGRFWMEIDELFEGRFGYRLGKSKIRYTLSRMGVKSGVSGREGGCRTPKSEIYQIGDEKKARGNVWVKVAKGGSTGTSGSLYTSGLWEKRQNLVWAQAHGTPLPKGHVILFADGDRENFDPDNLVAVPLEVSQTVYGMGLPHHDPASLQACVTLARIRMALTDRGNAGRA